MWERRTDALALSDLCTKCFRLILKFIARENPIVADEIVYSIRQKTLLLVENPTLGRIGQVAGTRELVNERYPYIAAYRICADEIQILAVLHTSRLWPDEF